MEELLQERLAVMIGKTLLHGLLGYVQRHMEMSVVLPKNLKKITVISGITLATLEIKILCN